MSLSSSRSRERPANGDIKRFFSFNHLRNRLTADRGLNDVVYVGHADIPQRAFLTIDREFDIALAANAIEADVFDPRHAD